MTNTKVQQAILVSSVAELALAGDLVLKHFLFGKTDLIENVSLFNGLVRFIEHRNYGISFNIPLPLLLTVLITLGVLAGALYYVTKKSERNLADLIGLGLLLGGALGNLVDRLWLGFVRDWLLLFGRSAINLADIFVLSGLFLLIIVSPRLDSQK